MTLREQDLIDMETERQAVEAIRAAMDELVERIADYPRSWGWGDGKGGALMRDLDERLATIGLSRTDDGFKNRGPARKALTATMKLAALKRDKYRCVACGSQEELTTDHIHPVIKGGTNDLANLQTLCLSCNVSKGVKPMDEWLATR